jgi:hypothetical protein
MLKKSSEFLLIIVMIRKHIRFFISTHIKFLQVEMYNFMSMEMKFIRWIVMMHGIFLMTIMKM